ncbi:hypothetical protein [Candidatus Uabimicrobium sp. HlEnr_7]|uniref:hypothetical protein n=1 Tax=Candidatus Uabimicrobium helgolandensis TaxID=3095367 RepID=UPI003555DB5D
MDDFLTFLIVLIFFIGPALRKLFEGQQQGKRAAPRKNRSRDEVKRYLERMRALQERQGIISEEAALYEEPKLESAQSDNRFSSISGKDENRFASISEQQQSNNFDRVSQAVEHDVTQHVNEHITTLQSSMHQVTSTKTSSPDKKIGIDELILQNKQLNDLQRAFVLSEIFGKPKSLRDVQDI